MNEMRKLMEVVQLEEGASSQQWEIAINNLIGEGQERFAGDQCWVWVMSELHGMLDFQPDDDGGLGHENVVGRNLRRAFGDGPDEQR